MRSRPIIDPVRHPCPAPGATTAIDEALALLDAVVDGELLVALPPDAADRERHSAGVRLIWLARDRLQRAGAAGA